jgi:hypothetical protein
MIGVKHFYSAQTCGIIFGQTQRYFQTIRAAPIPA